MTKNRGRKVEWTIAWSTRSGGLLLVASRFMLGFRTLTPVVCGATGTGTGQFFLWNSVSALGWAVSFEAAGYMGAAVDDIDRRHPPPRKSAGFALAIIIHTFLWELKDIWLLSRAEALY